MQPREHWHASVFLFLEEKQNKREPADFYIVIFCFNMRLKREKNYKERLLKLKKMVNENSVKLNHDIISVHVYCHWNEDAQAKTP